MKNIQHKLKKYQAPYVNGEKRSNKFNNTINRQYRHENRLLTLDHLNNELPYSRRLNTHEKELVTSVLETFQNDLKYLHRRATTEAIILAIIYTVKKRVKPNLSTEHKDYQRIFQKYDLTYPILTTILSRLCNYYLLHNPQIIRETTRYDQEILYKQQNSHQRMI